MSECDSISSVSSLFSYSGSNETSVSESESEYNIMTPVSSDSSGQNERSQHFIKPGVSAAIFKAMEKKVFRMSPKDRICALLVLEADIKQKLTYLTKEDYIIGLEDFGYRRTRTPADSVAVFMLRSVYGRWKQPVAFAFYNWPIPKADLIKFWKDIAKETHDIGLNLISLICTHNDYNLAALEDLRRETQITARENGSEVDENVIILNGKEIVPIFDPCTLFLNFRNAFLCKDLAYEENGVSKLARWDHIIHAFEIDEETSQFLEKVTQEHVFPELMKNNVNVNSMAQVFSSTMSDFMRSIIGKGGTCSLPLPEEARDTADILLFFDVVFDSINGGFTEPPPHKVFRTEVSQDSPHSPFWRDAIENFRSMQFLDEDPDFASTHFTTMIRTLEGFELIKQKILEMGYESFPARAFNLDPLETCYDLMRYWPKKRLTCRRFSKYYNMALEIQHMPEIPPENQNCELDGLTFLVSTKSIQESDV